MNTATANHRDRLATIRDRTRAAREQRARARTTLDAARAAHDDDAEAVATLALDHASVELETAEQLERLLLGSMAGIDNANGFGDDGFFDDPQSVAMLERLGHTTAQFGSVMLPWLDAETFAASLRPRAQTGDSGFPGLEGMRTQYGPIARQIYRPLTLLDLIAVGTMTGATYEFVQESGDLDAGVGETAEGAIKPEALVDFVEASVPARTIATWRKARRQVLADVAELQQVLTQRLSYQVQRRIERQVLIGDGQGQNLLGLLNTTGIGSVPNEAIPGSDLILKGITSVALADAVANGVVLHPTDYEAMLTATTSGSGERLDSSGAFSGPPDTIWGLPAIRSSVISPGTALVGDFVLGCTLLVREGLTVRISDADQDDFVRNQVTILAESRVALATWQPMAFAAVELAPTAPLAEKAAAKKS